MPFLYLEEEKFLSPGTGSQGCKEIAQTNLAKITLLFLCVVSPYILGTFPQLLKCVQSIDILSIYVLITQA